jgi:O-antigen ligase
MEARRLSLSGVIAMATAIAVVTAVAGTALLQRTSTSEAAQSDQDRLELLARVWEVADENFWLGSGPRSSQDAMYNAGIRLVVENSYLQILISLGVLGLVAVIAFLASTVRTMHRRGAHAAVAGLAAFTVMSGTYNLWESNVGMLALFAGMAGAELVTRGNGVK